MVLLLHCSWERSVVLIYAPALMLCSGGYIADGGTRDTTITTAAVLLCKYSDGLRLRPEEVFGSARWDIQNVRFFLLSRVS